MDGAKAPATKVLVIVDLTLLKAMCCVVLFDVTKLYIFYFMSVFNSKFMGRFTYWAD